MDYLDEVALAGLKLAERDAERGSLDAENLETIDATVDEMMDNLTDFEPRRWFRKVHAEIEEAPGGLASLANLEQDEEVDQLPMLAGALAPGWEMEDAVLCVGGRTPLDEAAAAMLAGALQRQASRLAPFRAMPFPPPTSFRSKPQRPSSFVSLILARARTRPMSVIWCGGCGASCQRAPPSWSASGRMTEAGPRSRRWQRPPKPMPMPPR